MAADSRSPRTKPQHAPPNPVVSAAASPRSDGAVRDAGSPHRALIFAIVGTALTMSTIDGTIVATALHAIEKGLRTSINWTSWTITGYSVGLVLMLSLSGKLSVRYGQRRFFLVSVTVFAGASLFCGLATNIYVLIGLRVLQAAGGAGFTPSATGIVVEHFGSARDRAVGLFGSMFSIGSMIGPIFGGFFVAYWSWRGIFFVNVPLGAILVLLTLRYVPRDADRQTKEPVPVDALGMVLLGVGVLALMLGISELGEVGTRPSSPLFIVPVVVGVVALTQFGRHIRRAPDPFISPRFIAGRGFAPVNVFNIMYGGMVAGLISLVPLYAIQRYHLHALGSGTLLIAEGAAVIVTTPLAVVALRRTGYRLPLYLGSGTIVVGVAALALRPSGISGHAWLALACCIIGIGAGFSSPASRNAGLQLAPQASASIAALRSTGRQVGQIGAVSVTAAILARAVHPGEVQAVVFLAAALLLLVCMPTIAGITEHRGSW